MTNNEYFLATYGAEMIFEIARFWGNIAILNQTTQRYEIHNVVGPDEYHEQYPNSDQPGINNNAYTNIMAVWVLERAIMVLSILQVDRRNELMAQLDITEEEIESWHDITKTMMVPFHHGNIISQFEGYEQLDEFNWDSYSKKYGNIERLDRVLKAEGDSPNHYKVSKQADVLMLFYLFPKDELKRIFHQLDYTQFNDDCVCKTIEYYEKRTSHGSTLSKVVFASELSCIDEDAARSHFQEALVSDISDIQGGTTPEGIHLGAMSGTVDIIMRHYAGVRANAYGLSFNPCLPSDIHSLRFRMQHRENWYRIDINNERFRLTLETGKDAVTTVNIYGNKIELEAGNSRDIKLQ